MNCSACHTANWFLPGGVPCPGPTGPGHSIPGVHSASNGVLPTCMDGSCGYPSLTAGPSPASCPNPDWDRGCNGHSVPAAPCGRPHNSVQAPLHHKPTMYQLLQRHAQPEPSHPPSRLPHVAARQPTLRTSFNSGQPYLPDRAMLRCALSRSASSKPGMNCQPLSSAMHRLPKGCSSSRF